MHHVKLNLYNYFENVGRLWCSSCTNHSTSNSPLKVYTYWAAAGQLTRISSRLYSNIPPLTFHFFIILSSRAGIIQGFNVIIKHEWWNSERVVKNESWMINYELIIKLRETTFYDVSIRKFDYKRVNNEFLIIVSKILVILDFMPRLGRH